MAVHMVDPVVKRVQVDAANGNARRRNLYQPSEKALFGRLQVYDDDRIRLHSLRTLDNNRDSLPTPDAQRRKPPICFAPLHFVDECRQNSCAAGSNWMAERDRA